jgi:putative DNA primase/helicase
MNHTSVIQGSDHGIWRRIHLVPFTVTIAKED